MLHLHGFQNDEHIARLHGVARLDQPLNNLRLKGEDRRECMLQFCGRTLKRARQARDTHTAATEIAQSRVSDCRCARPN